MKQSIVITWLICLSTILQAQNFNEARQTITADMDSTNYFKNRNLTATGMNLFLAKKAVRYLSDEGDVSLYKSFFIADIADGELTLGRNFAFKTKLKPVSTKEAAGQVQHQPKEGKVWGLLTPVIKAKAEDNFAEVFSKGKFNEEISGGLKFTWFIGGSVFFDGPNDKILKAKNLSVDSLSKKWTNPPAQQKYMAQQRMYNLEKLVLDFEETKKIIDKTSTQMLIKYEDEDDIKSFINDKTDEANKEAIKKWYDAEVEAFDSEKAYNAVSAYWVSAWGNYTFIGSDLNVRDTVFAKTMEVKFKGYDINTLYTYMFDGRKGLFYFSGGLSFVHQNSIKTKQDIKKYDLNDYLQNQKPDTIQLVSVNKDDIYVGRYKEFNSTKMTLQLLWLFPEFTCKGRTFWNKNFGVSAKWEQWNGTYDPMNFTLGVPLMLSGKDADKKINLEIQFKWVDVTKNIESYKKDDRFSAGVNLAIPFSSLIY